MIETANFTQLFRLLPQMLDQIEDSICVMKVDAMSFRYHYVNRAAIRLNGFTLDPIGQTFFDVHTSQMANFLHEIYTKVISERRTTIKYEDDFILPNGMISKESIVTPIFEENGQIEFILSITRDTTERKKYEHLLYQYAYLDELTELHNRRYLFEYVINPVAISLLDLDYFKNINDTLGHQAGDIVLVEVGRRLKAKFGSDHLLVRLGGDEFVIVSTEESGPPDRIAENIIDIFLAPFVINGRQMKLSGSIGVAIRENNEDIHTLLKQADIALYRSKEDGRNRCYVYEATNKYSHVESFIHEIKFSNTNWNCNNLQPVGHI